MTADLIVEVSVRDLQEPLVTLVMTSPCNGKALCFHAHPPVFLFEQKFLHIWTSYHKYITNPCLSVSR